MFYKERLLIDRRNIDEKDFFLPLLRMQSGHHQVAEALMDMFQNRTEEFILKKIDLLSYTNESLEKMVTNGYLKWIRYAPGTYSLAYKNLFLSFHQQRII